MKVLFDHDSPFVLDHGGFQIQIEQTIAGIRANAVETEPLRWWDRNQRGDVIHFFGRPTPIYTALAHAQGFKVVILPLLSGLGSRSPAKLLAQRTAFGAARRILPRRIQARLSWDCFLEADACIANTRKEAHLMTCIFGTPPERVHIIPNGIEDVFSKSQPVERSKWLVCTAVITERKRVLETAQASVLAKTPLWVIGRPYSPTDPYGKSFIEFARQNPEWIRYEGSIEDRASLARAYRQARGFVLLSTRETLSLSSFEAAACECPLFLSDLPWARETFQQSATYCPLSPPPVTAPLLRKFYDEAPSRPLPPKPQSWVDVGAMFKKVYEKVLSTS